MSTVQSTTSMPQTNTAGVGLSAQLPREVSAKSTLASTSRTEEEIRREIASVENSLRALERERLQKMDESSPEKQKHALVFSAMATTQDVYEEDKRLNDEARKENGEEPEVSTGLINPLRMLSIAQQSKILGALERISGMRGEISGLQSRLDALNAELRSLPPATTPTTPRT